MGLKTEKNRPYWEADVKLYAKPKKDQKTVLVVLALLLALVVCGVIALHLTQGIHVSLPVAAGSIVLALLLAGGGYALIKRHENWTLRNELADSEPEDILPEDDSTDLEMEPIMTDSSDDEGLSSFQWPYGGTGDPV